MLHINGQSPTNIDVIQNYITQVLGGLSWKEPVISFIDYESLPESLTDGDRYIAGNTSEGWEENNIYQWDEGDSVWVETIPLEGSSLYVKDESEFYIFIDTTSGWSKLPYFPKIADSTGILTNDGAGNISWEDIPPPEVEDWTDSTSDFLTSGDGTVSRLFLSNHVQQISSTHYTNFLDFDLRLGTAIDSSSTIRLGRNTNSGTGILYTNWYKGDDSTTISMWFDHKNGRLRIGTSENPTSTLHLSGTNQNVLSMSNNKGIAWINSFGNVTTQIWMNTANVLILKTGFNGGGLRIYDGATSTILMRVEDGGNVGIGTGTNVPTEKLEVTGTVKATAFVGDGSGLTNLTIDSTSYSTNTVVYQYYHTGSTLPADSTSGVYLFTPGGIQCGENVGTVLPWTGFINSISVYVDITDAGDNGDDIFLNIDISGEPLISELVSDYTNGVKKIYQVYNLNEYTFYEGDTLEVSLYSDSITNPRVFTNAIVTVEAGYFVG